MRESPCTLQTNIPLPFEILSLQEESDLELPLMQSCVAAGFPSPADNYLEDHVNLQRLLISNPSATYLVRVRGESMIDARLYDGDLLVVDRSLEAQSGQVIIGVVDGEFTVKQLVLRGDVFYLQPANQQYPPLKLTDEMDFKPWGVVVWSLHKIKRNL
ncbi:LexA family protein [Pontibacter silvestris]|uniref:LexA family protein n=1 Tax=Pontibacter silvestris TaxID=2305183 RepID=A0ABW4X1F6_9BACT|nr:translesion error-prone DNA polymerase V autoproteolytic subunit [Pontibacter silvestris]MCC9135948.1 translesion error-prone DNA polymerase V autoproteolytic subunit [Pontibacter silvestris]